MPNVIYAGLRNPQRDQQIHSALVQMTVSEAAEHFSLTPSTVRAAAKRISGLVVFELKLIGGGKDIPIGPIAARTFRRAALGAYRHFCGTFRNLELQSWALTDGTTTISIQDLRDLDGGMASVTEDDCAA